MDLTHFTFDVDADGIATLIMDQAGAVLNTLSPETGADLVPILDRLETDSAIRAVVIGSAKPDNFVAGADIRWFSTLTDAASAEAALKSVQDAFDRLARLGKPVVAAIHGACLGGGLELALACTGRVCSDDERKTQLGQPEIQLGLLPGAGGTQRLPRLIGIAPALDLILTGRSVRPRKALKLGLVDEVVPKERLMATARDRAQQAIH
ncbi:MAG: enoyl-CoA hydratase-related protein, partial [Acidimicrobiia bacterium]|nr:enoyl-CoA hydratase-related protein [Acidimicrobiia bacterium]